MEWAGIEPLEKGVCLRQPQPLVREQRAGVGADL
jgi:hypothetical protein